MGQIRAGFFRTGLRGCLSALALMAYLAHALIPTGFMPGSLNGQAQFVACDGHMAGTGHVGHHGNPGSKGDSRCPFALGGAAAPLPAHLDPALAHVAPDLHVPFIERSVPFEAPLRHNAPRGPPMIA
jgi:hypothetical protein